MPSFKKETAEKKEAREVEEVLNLQEKIEKLKEKLKEKEAKPHGRFNYVMKEGIKREISGLQSKFSQKLRNLNDAQRAEVEQSLGEEPAARVQNPERQERREEQRPEAQAVGKQKGGWWPFRSKAVREEGSNPEASSPPPSMMEHRAEETAPSQAQHWSEWAWENTKVYITEGSFIYETVKSLYKDRPEEEVRGKLEGSGTLDSKEVRSINEALRKEIETMPKVPPKTYEDKQEIVYEIDGEKLTQKTGANGKYDFEPSANFTGTLSVNRTDSNGKVLDDQVDIIHFENGKVVSLIPAEHGERMFNSLGADIERKAKEISIPVGGVSVASHEPGDVGEVFVNQRTQDIGAVLTPPTTPSRSTTPGRGDYPHR